MLTDAIPSLKKSGLSFARVRASVAQVSNEASAYPHLEPETTKSTEFGAELGALDNRVTLDGYLPMGSIQPKWTGGWSNTVRYRAFTFGALLDIRRGGNIVSLTNALGNTSGVLESSLKGREIDWNNPGLVVRGIDRESCGAGSHGAPNGRYACVGGGAQNTTNVLSEQYFVALGDNMEPYVYDASYVKLRELRVGFDVPQRWTSRLNVTAVNIAFVGRNLSMWTNVPNIDPEFAYSDGNAQGIEYAVVPNARSIGFSVRMTP